MKNYNNITEANLDLSIGGAVKSTLVSRNITVFGKRTSVRLEPEMWASLREISEREGCSIHDVCTLIGMRKKENTSLTAAIRVFIMLYFRASSTEDGHRKVGHGDFETMKKRARIPQDKMQFFEGRSRRFKSSMQSNRMTDLGAEDSEQEASMRNSY